MCLSSTLKKLALFSILLCSFLFLNPANAQVFNTAQSLQRGSISLTASPTVFMKDGFNTIALFTYGTYGIGNGVDLNVKAGFFEDTNYFGASLEWSIRRTVPYVSLTTGGHTVDDFGLDATLNVTYPTQNGFDIYGGLDTDLILDDDPDLPAWVFLGATYHLQSQLDVMVEGNIGLFEIAPHILAAGFVFYF